MSSSPERPAHRIIRRYETWFPRQPAGFRIGADGLARIGIPALGPTFLVLFLPHHYSFRIIIPYESSPESSQIWCDGWHLAAIGFRTTLFPDQASAVHSRKN
jgi:hypothetical protein